MQCFKNAHNFYRVVENFGEGKLWRIWRFVMNSSRQMQFNLLFAKVSPTKFFCYMVLQILSQSFVQVALSLLSTAISCSNWILLYACLKESIVVKNQECVIAMLVMTLIFLFLSLLSKIETKFHCYFTHFPKLSNICRHAYIMPE